MCGINMILRRDGSPAEREDITRMCSAISHRGPDGAGYALLDRGALAFGHVRQSEGRSREVPYWQPTFNTNPAISFTEAKDEVRRLFTRAVERCGEKPAAPALACNLGCWTACDRTT